MRAAPESPSKLDFRMATPADAASMLDIYAPIVENTSISLELKAPDIETFRRRVEDTLKIRPWIVASSNSQVAAYAYASEHRARMGYQWSVDVSVYVHENFRRRGLG